MSVTAISSTLKEGVEQACLNRAQAEPEPLDNEPDGDLAHQNCLELALRFITIKSLIPGSSLIQVFFLE